MWGHGIGSLDYARALHWPADGFFVACKLFPEAGWGQVSPADIAEAEEIVYLLGQVETLRVNLRLRHICWTSPTNPRSIKISPPLSFSHAYPSVFSFFPFFACLLGDKWEQLLTFNLQLFVLVQQIWSSSGSALTALPQRTSTSDRRVKSIVLQTSR